MEETVQRPRATRAAPAADVGGCVDLPAGTCVGGRWEIIRPIGHGAHASVHAAVGTADGSLVALKVLRRPANHAGTGSDPLELLRREAGFLRSIRHPNVIRVLDDGVCGNCGYLVLELVDGETLRDRLDRVGQLDVRRALGRAAQLANAMACWHELGLIHRDLKPANLMLERRTDRLVVIDFGIACFTHEMDDGSRTSAGGVLGSPEYMSPEQCRAGRLSPASDVYTLGVLLYEMLTGQPPFLGTDPTEVMRRQVMEFPRELRLANPALRSLPHLLAIEDVVLRCLEKSPGARFQDARALERALRELWAHPALANRAP